MQGDAVKALRMVAEQKGWDPTKIDGKPIEVGLTIRKPDGAGDVSLSPFPGPAADSNPDNPTMNDKVGWAHPAASDGNIGKPGKESDPFQGKPL